MSLITEFVLGASQALPVVKTSVLPIVKHDEDGLPIGVIHWFVHEGTLYVSPKAMDAINDRVY